jgi:hypothetical protein
MFTSDPVDRMLAQDDRADAAYAEYHVRHENTLRQARRFRQAMLRCWAHADAILDFQMDEVASGQRPSIDYRLIAELQAAAVALQETARDLWRKYSSERN